MFVSYSLKIVFFKTRLNYLVHKWNILANTFSRNRKPGYVTVKCVNFIRWPLKFLSAFVNCDYWIKMTITIFWLISIQLFLLIALWDPLGKSPIVYSLGVRDRTGFSFLLLLTFTHTLKLWIFLLFIFKIHFYFCIFWWYIFLSCIVLRTLNMKLLWNIFCIQCITIDRVVSNILLLT